MRFSIFFEAQMNDASAANERRVMLDSITQAVHAEEVGFDGVWAAEHHRLKWYSHMSAPEIFLTAVATRTGHQTSKIRRARHLGGASAAGRWSGGSVLRYTARASGIGVLLGSPVEITYLRTRSRQVHESRWD